jgi:hypothetical protein
MNVKKSHVRKKGKHAINVKAIPVKTLLQCEDEK